ncbi:NnrU family protein [Lentibacter algarum]|uniref:NnrU family protein n=1 Tax=Lentibacter algarum TaxID=576131 RepID=UPI001C09D4ED|nr:NnrU family protein [Lentibacter algarum]MBU2983544.1 NnrU family protein [Lentibacter algarum]
MTILIAGLVLWYGGHFWKRALPEKHAAMGAKAKGVSALVIVASVVLMVIGYRATESFDLWIVPSFMKHITVLLVLIALYFTSPGPSKGAVFYKMRHPMLIGFKIWTIAHLLVNPDVASFVLFGGLLAWAVLEVIVINRSEPEFTPKPRGSIGKDAMFLAISVLLVGVIGYVHGLVGPNPFGG